MIGKYLLYKNIYIEGREIIIYTRREFLITYRQLILRVYKYYFELNLQFKFTKR